MTTIERKRAVRLEMTARMYGSMGSVNKMLAFLTIATLIIDIAMFHTAAEDDQLFAIFLMHCLFMSMFSALVVIMNTYPIGDTGFIIDTGNVVIAGSAYSGKFLCTLPFNAKDLLNLRLIHFEKQLAVFSSSTIFLLIAAEILRTAGYTIEAETIGICCVSAVLYEALLLVLTLVRLRSDISIGIMFAPTIPMIFFCAYMDGLSEIESAETMKKMFGPLNIFSGVPGIIVIIAAAAALVCIGEIYLKHKTGVSWNIK